MPSNQTSRGDTGGAGRLRFKIRTTLGLIAVALAVAACGSGEPSFGEPGGATAEVAPGPVPLALPPNFTLRPSDNGEDPERDRLAARRILGQRWSAVRGTEAGLSSPQPAPLSAEAALRRDLGTDQALPNIRELLAEETGAPAFGDRFSAEAVLCWPRAPAEDGCGDAEAGRERAGVADATAGPEIERARGGLMENLF